MNAEHEAVVEAFRRVAKGWSAGGDRRAERMVENLIPAVMRDLAARSSAPSAGVVDTLTPSEAITAFGAWLTCRSGAMVIGATHHAGPMAEACAAFYQSQGMAPPRDHFHTLTQPYPDEHPAAPSVSPAVEGDAGELPEVVELSGRAEELAERLVASGPKAAHVSASETHELGEWVLAAAPLIRRLATAEQPGSAVQGPRLRQGDVHAIACVLAREDGYDPEDMHGGLYDLRWSGGPTPEPEGDAWNMDYLPKAERIVAALGGTTPQPAPAAEPLTVESAPVGTRAPAIMGGHWYKTQRGWKWNGPDGSGGVFPRPGGDWTGKLIAPAAEQGDTFQRGVEAWMAQCFVPSLYSNMTERGDRLLEEVLELLQAHGYDRGRVGTLVDYVYGRPAGQPGQEVGGVMVTLAGYCWISELNMHAEGWRELERITTPEVMAKIRAKQEAKNALHFDTPLPGAAGAQG